jgi:P-type Ca2+ transporter type 2C
MAEFYRLDAAAALKELQSNKEKGLSASDAQARLAKYGPNELPAGEGTNILKLLVEQFTDVMVIILIIAAVISGFLGEITDVIVIMIIVVLNAALGVYQEFRAEQALAALSAMQVPLVRIRRDGEVHQISATELVPGDIVLLEEGDSIPADGRILDSVNLRIEEAALTGESVPVDKTVDTITGEGSVALGDRHNMAFMGTAVTYGRGTLLVTYTGLQTEIGKIAGMLMGVEEGITPLQRRLNQLGKTLATGALVVVAVVFMVGVFIQHIPPQEMFLTAVSLAVAAVPEGLPALVTIGLSLGASRMVKRNALIRRLPAVETLGSVTIICSDKTGTLTKNEMTATYMALPGHDYINITGVGYTPSGEFVNENGAKIDPKEDEAIGRFLKAMALSTNAHLEPAGGTQEFHVVGDTTEGALLIAAQKVGWTRKYLEETMPRVAELPFSSDRKAMTTVHDVVSGDGLKLFDTPHFISITKGAPDKLIEWAQYEHFPEGRQELTPERRDRWNKRVDKMASEGLRVLGIAYRPLETAPQGNLTEDIERDLVMIGLVGILDPSRPEAKEAVKVARGAGIRSVMITGDHALTAEAIARDLGIITGDQKAVTGNELDQMNDAQIAEALKKTSAFARVSPSHKLKIVQILQGQNHVVSMTGDGVNDAPALKQADIGVAMGITGTEVSKGASEMVLTDDNFASIVAAIEEGRAIYDNIKKFIKYLLSSNVGEILVMFVALLVGLKIPLLAIQILWINLVTDGLPAIALGFEPAEKDVMRRKPRPHDESIFAGGMGRHIMWVGTLITVLTLGGFMWGHSHNGLEPFSPTLGLEKFDRAALVTMVERSGAPLTGAEAVVVPDNWDSLTAEERIHILEPQEVEGGIELEGSDAGLIGAAERIPRTIAFSVLAMVQMFHVMAIHAGNSASFFRVFFKGNPLLFWAVLSTFILQLIVIYVPFMQTAFKTSALGLGEMLLCGVLGSVVLFAVELEKVILSGDAKREPELVAE